MVGAKVLSVGIHEKRLCSRCGTCTGVCPTEAIGRDAELFPSWDVEKCTSCELCARVCPGAGLSFKRLHGEVLGRDEWPPDYCGHYQEAFVAHSTDTDVRQGGSSGGVVTGLLLFLLETGKIDGALVTSIDPANPYRAKSYLAKTPEEIMAARQSKYIIAPVNTALREIRESSGRYAYVGLPCQIQGLREWALINPVIRKRIPYIIGLFCLTSFEPWIVEELVKIKGDRGKKLKDFRFREGDWPGNICALYTDGTSRKLHYGDFKDGAINYLAQLYSPYRCRLCTDGTAEFADISVGDAWMRLPDKRYQYPAMSTVLVRTNAGWELFSAAVEAGKIAALPVSREQVCRTYTALRVQKKIYARIKATRWKKLGLPVPVYDEPQPRFGAQQRWGERRSAFYQSLGRFKYVRMFVLKVLLSRFMTPLITLRRICKERKFG